MKFLLRWCKLPIILQVLHQVRIGNKMLSKYSNINYTRINECFLFFPVHCAVQLHTIQSGFDGIFCTLCVISDNAVNFGGRKLHWHSMQFHIPFTVYGFLAVFRYKYVDIAIHGHRTKARRIFFLLFNERHWLLFSSSNLFG